MAGRVGVARGACSARLTTSAPLLVCGMGGSAIGGDLAGAVARRAAAAPAADRARLRAADVGHAHSVVLCASYSGQHRGDACLLRGGGRAGRDPHRRHDRRPAGRRRPRRRRPRDPAAGGAPAPGRGRLHARRGARGGGALGRGAASRTEIDAAAASLVDLAASWGPDADSDSLAKRVAQRVHKTCVCVYGAGPTAPIAMRWKTQINENAKVPAFCGRAARGRPQRDRAAGRARPRWAASWRVFLEDSDQHPRVRQRIELTAALIEPEAAGTLRLESQGVNRGRARAVAGAAR